MAQIECEGRPDSNTYIVQIVHRILPAQDRVRLYQTLALAQLLQALPVHKSPRRTAATSIETDYNSILRRHR